MQLKKVQKIVVTGGSGFVGSNICRMLAALHPEKQIISLDIQAPEAQKEKDPFLAKFKNMHFKQGDCLLLRTLFDTENKIELTQEQSKLLEETKGLVQESDSVVHTVGALLDGSERFNYKDLIKEIEQNGASFPINQLKSLAKRASENPQELLNNLIQEYEKR
mmetsp:Transcript_11101/g.18617  ORF Transcript_11101/g.18617 Transcript_11101/m.18617 type:complete len:163 (-) Transcript_11101:559-1047(-)